MKLTRFSIFALLLPFAAAAAPLAEPAAVHAAPDAASPTLVTLPAGATPPAAETDNVPPGWTAVSVPGPHTVYVSDQDVLKNFDVKPGASYRVAPEKSAPVIGIAADADQVEITGLTGRWIQLSLKSPVTGYIQTAKPKVVASAPTPVNPVSPAPAPAATVSAGQPAPGRAVEPAGPSLPRVFAGTLVSSQSAFRPRRPYDYQLNDSRGVRYAYLDLGKLLLTEQLESYLDRAVEVYGTASNLPGTKDIVIRVETLKLP